MRGELDDGATARSFLQKLCVTLQAFRAIPRAETPHRSNMMMWSTSEKRVRDGRANKNVFLLCILGLLMLVVATAWLWHRSG